MAPKGKKANATEKQKDREEEREDPLQAVILCDSYETRFNPFTLERPRCLLPLANTPLIEYTLEFLANAGVEEVFVYCGAHTEQVEEYMQLSKWTSRSSPFAKLELIRSTSRSIGDAMRDLDKRAILAGDFLVVYGDVISNLPLEAALAVHRERRIKDKNAIMTMVLREAGAKHRTKAQGTSPVFVIDPVNNRCLHYEQMRPKQRDRFVNIDPAILSGHGKIDVRQDLIDCGIDICTPDVLALWSDNFDYEAPRKGFLHSVLKDYELNGKTIHTHIVNDHYAARVRNLHSYDSVSKDIISRWAYPLCPDSNLLRDQTYRLQKGNVYKEEGVVLARSCVLNRRTVIGKDSAIGDASTITNSIIGRNCSIGRNVTIDGAYIWDHAVISDGAVITDAVVANEAMVGKRCIVQPGALISYGVRVADGMTVKGSSRITRMKQKRDYDSEELVRGLSDAKVVGEGGDGFEFEDSDEENEDEIEGLAAGTLYNMEDMSLSSDSISTLNSEGPSEGQIIHHDRSAAGSFISVASDDSHASQHVSEFHHEAALGIFESLQKGDKATDISTELTALRMGQNASEHQVRRAVIAAVMKHTATLVESGTTAQRAAKDVITKLASILEKTMFDKDTTAKADQVDFLLLMQTDLVHRKESASIMLAIATELYRLDIIEVEGFEQWWEDDKSTASEEMQSVRGKMGPFIEEYVLGADEEESEEGSEDE